MLHKKYGPSAATAYRISHALGSSSTPATRRAMRMACTNESMFMSSDSRTGWNSMMGKVALRSASPLLSSTMHGRNWASIEM